MTSSPLDFDMTDTDLLLKMEPDKDLNPDMDDLPLRANTNHILVRHYVLDLTVHFDREVISSSVVLFLEPCAGLGTKADEDVGSGAGTTKAGGCRDVDTVEDGTKGLGETTTRMEKMFGASERDGAEFQALPAVGSQTAAKPENIQSSHSWETTSDRDFTLVLDCCDLDVSKVEEVDVTSVASTVAAESISDVSSVNPHAAFIQNLISVPSDRWRQKHQLFLLCSRAHGAQGGGSLHFQRDRWSLQVRKKGVVTPQEFPRCVFTLPVLPSTTELSSPARSRLLPCQHGMQQFGPPVTSLIWNYYVTMPMPASTFTLAVGHWHQVTAEIPPALERGVRDGAHCSKITKPEAGPGEWTEADLRSGLVRSISEVVKGSPLKTGSGDQATRSDSAFCYSSLEDEGLSVTDCSGMVDDGICCSHGDYPCRFTEQSARSQRVIPHRVFGPFSLLQKAQGVLKLLPQCLAAAHSLLGVHPFPRLDVLIVPAGFSSLGMAR
ncbi:hypothetical protein FQN60_018464 [Etheostoma spectabile]|uniref:Uncharacterized protein n=1 Tax=Etheostoma spectabile TaxID=54343 RepID=A0A5J5DI99_9PERO|nr:hypothetical protein FQN60_018464 [Etheostoma spectabile]